MTPARVVLDASVALARLLGERTPDWVGELWSGVRDGHVELLVPTFFWLETGNALSRLRTIADEQVLEGLIRLEGLGIRSVEVDASLWLRAAALARAHRLTTYDAAYLSLAESTGAPLATLDEHLGAVADGLGIRHPGAMPRRILDEPARYASREPDPTSLAALGRRLAELRHVSAPRLAEPQHPAVSRRTSSP